MTEKQNLLLMEIAKQPTGGMKLNREWVKCAQRLVEMGELKVGPDGAYYLAHRVPKVTSTSGPKDSFGV